jgi:hypothetical protein
MFRFGLPFYVIILYIHISHKNVFFIACIRTYEWNRMRVQQGFVPYFCVF